MKVILLENLKKIGTIGEIIDVKRGFARNFLIANKKGSYIHFKIKGNGNMIDELEKTEAIDKKVLRYLTIKVKEFDLNSNYFSKKEDAEKTETKRN